MAFPRREDLDAATPDIVGKYADGATLRELATEYRCGINAIRERLIGRTYIRTNTEHRTGKKAL